MKNVQSRVEERLRAQVEGVRVDEREGGVIHEVQERVRAVEMAVRNGEEEMGKRERLRAVALI